MTKKIVKKCKVDGNLGRYGRHFAMCGYIVVGDKSLCGAHGNTKCEHMDKQALRNKSREG